MIVRFEMNVTHKLNSILQMFYFVYSGFLHFKIVQYNTEG